MNVLLDIKRFPAGDIPTAKKVVQAEFDGAIHVDTSDRNAVESDDHKTENAYKEANVNLFVSSVQNGGVGEHESKWLRELYSTPLKFTQSDLHNQYLGIKNVIIHTFCKLSRSMVAF